MLRSALASPWARLTEAPLWTKITAVVGGVVEWVLGVPLLMLLLILTGVSLVDYLLGSEIAKNAGTYHPDVARAGVIGKMSGVLLVAIIWSIEAASAQAGLIDTHSMLATALTVVLLVAEIESFDQHREHLVGRPTPLVRPILEFLRGVARGAIPGSDTKRGNGNP